LKVEGRFEEISFERAYEIVKDRIKAVEPDENAFFAGARLTNEELYLIQKLARVGASTNNVTSFHYLNRGIGYKNNSNRNVPFEQIKGASKIYLIGSEIHEEQAVAGFMVQNARYRQNIPVAHITDGEKSTMEYKVDEVIRISSYYHFIKAVAYYLVANNYQNSLFIEGNCEGYDQYKEQLLKENFVELVDKSGVRYMDQVVEFAKEYNRQMNAIIIFSENHLSSNACQELFNLAMITGKLGKNSSGLVSLKEKNNAQGLFDMGVCMKLGVGATPIDNTRLVTGMKKAWKVKSLPTNVNPDLYKWLEDGLLKNLFIFGEDPLGTAIHRTHAAGWLSVAEFKVVQDYFMTDTAQLADLILPASLPIETGGSFTNTQGYIQEFEARFESETEKQGWEQIRDLLRTLGSEEPESLDEIFSEAMSLLPQKDDAEKLSFNYTGEDNYARIFNHGCDNVVKMFDEEFDRAFTGN
jgi:predicted molibdopterin-dependent oxidoreductase YjgC